MSKNTNEQSFPPKQEKKQEEKKKEESIKQIEDKKSTETKGQEQEKIKGPIKQIEDKKSTETKGQEQEKIEKEEEKTKESNKQIENEKLTESIKKIQNELAVKKKEADDLNENIVTKGKVIVNFKVNLQKDGNEDNKIIKEQIEKQEKLLEEDNDKLKSLNDEIKNLEKQEQEQELKLIENKKDDTKKDDTKKGIENNQDGTEKTPEKTGVLSRLNNAVTGIKKNIKIQSPMKTIKSTMNVIKDKFKSKSPNDKSPSESLYSRLSLPKPQLNNAISNVKSVIKSNDNEKQKLENTKLKIAEQHVKLADVSKFNQLKEHNTNLPKDLIVFHFHERITKPIFYKFYPIMVFILLILSLAIFSISILNFIMYIIYYIYEVIRIIFNEDTLNYNTLMYKTILKYLKITEKDFKDEIYYIFTEQYICYKNVDIFFFTFLTLGIPFLVYLILFIFYKLKGDNYILHGGIHFQPLVLQLMAIIIAFMILHIVVFKYLFGNDIYKELKKVKADIIGFDKYIYSKIYLNSDNKNFYEKLENNNIDEINDDINSDIEAGSQSAERKIFTYIIYSYLNEIVHPSNKEDRNLMKKYILNDNGDDYLNTFVGLLNYKKKTIKRYYTELNFLDIFVATKAEFVNNIKITLDKDIDYLNKKIINQYNQNIPYFYIFLYMIVILIINTVFVIIMFYMIATSNAHADDEIFPDSIKVIIRNAFAYMVVFILRLRHKIFGF